MTTVHLVYPHRPVISCPDAIGRKLGERLQRHYEVRYHDWDEPYLIRPQPGDVLLGHAHPVPFTCFRRSMAQPGWRRVLLMQPYHHGDRWQVSYLETIVHRVDLFLAITGNYWFSRIPHSRYAHWLPKMVHLDLAVDRDDFPPLKTTVNPPGQRRFVYIGHSRWTKNPGYLSQIAAAAPGIPLAWIGSGARAIPGLQQLGFQDFSSLEGRHLVAQHDFMVTVGRADANPTTVLEAMAWGLIPVCTPQSGYVGYPGIVNVPLDDAAAAAEVLQHLQVTPEDELRAMQVLNWHLLDTHFNWDRMARQVVQAIEDARSPSCARISSVHDLTLRWLAALSPSSPYRPANTVRWLGSILKRRLRRRFEQ